MENNQLKLFEVLHRASLFLKENHCDGKIAEILLQHHLDVDRTRFHLMMHQTIPSEVYENVIRDLKSHVETGIPVQYLVGYEYFYGRKFYVDEHVLIPRPETEELVEHALALLRTDRREKRTIVDVGTGSGVIAITLALELNDPNIQIFATDISKDALQVAQKNAQYHHSHIQFLQGDFLEPILGHNIKIDYLISNPPYIQEVERDSLSKTVRDFEPELALFAGDDGLRAYRKILEQLQIVAQEHVHVIFEIGYDQGVTVPHLIQHVFPGSKIHIKKDINKKDRIVSASIQV